MAFCYFITGPRGSGKGVYSVKMMVDTLSIENRVASNVDIHIDNLSFQITKPLFIRLPDKPRSTDLFSLGPAYDMSDGVKPELEGLILLDEISLFLNSHKDKDFAELMRFFMLSRKLGWNLAFVCQNKDQVQDTFYKSLCNKLIVCRDNSLFKIPYFSKILENLHLDSLFDRGHEAYIFAGRSELDEVESVVSFSNLPYRQLYNTNQLFEEDLEYINDAYIDMRASYTYVPTYITTKQKFIDQHLEQIQKLSNEDNTTMAIKKSGLSSASIAKIGAMLLFLVVFLYFNNPMDNPLIAEELPPEPVTQQSNQSIPSIPQHVVSKTDIPVDYIRELLENYKPRLSAHTTSETLGISLIIDFYESDSIYERLVLDDFHRNGYSVTPSGSNAVIISSGDYKRRVSAWHLPEKPTPQITQVADSSPIF